VAGSQKCLACPPGLAVVSVSEKAWEIIEKTPSKPFYFDLKRFREARNRWESPTTPAVPLFYALDEGLKLIREEGLEPRFKRHEKCAKAFYSAVYALKLVPYSNEKNRSNTVIAVSVPPGVDSEEVRRIMRERYGVVIAGGIGKLKQAIFRIGCMGSISEIETLSTISALENTLIDIKYPVKNGVAMAEARCIFCS